jgi:hypothetical protein
MIYSRWDRFKNWLSNLDFEDVVTGFLRLCFCVAALFITIVVVKVAVGIVTGEVKL